MGCQQTTTKSPPVIIATSPTQNYIKSSLKTPRSRPQDKTEKFFALKPRESKLNKSVNFNEQVRVKVRTPTPREQLYERTTPRRIIKRRVPTDGGDFEDDNNDVASISSQEDEVAHERIKTAKQNPARVIPKTASNAFWQKRNSIGVEAAPPDVKSTPKLPPTAIHRAPELKPNFEPSPIAIPKQPDAKRNPEPYQGAVQRESEVWHRPEVSRTSSMRQPEPRPVAIHRVPVNLAAEPVENFNMPIGHHFRIRRRVQPSFSVEDLSAYVSTEASSMPTSRVMSQPSSPVNAMRSSQGASPVLIEHHAAFDNENSTPRTSRYASSRQANVTNK